MKYYMYNRLANNGIKPTISEGIKVVDCVDMDYEEFFNKLNPEDEVVFIGGDGTLNRLVNTVDCSKIKNNIYLLPNGTGNDFMNDIGGKLNEEILINKYLVNLPVVHVKDRDVKFLNNMSFGLDGYCCEMADIIKSKTPNKKINYTTIAIKGLLFDFTPKHAWIEVDGKTYEFDNVWLAPSMNGRYVGGGMMMAPSQDRMGDTLSLVVYSCKSKLKSLILFPSIFKGEHVSHTDVVTIVKGHKIHVKYDKPCAVQIDGDTVLDVIEYWAEK